MALVGLLNTGLPQTFNLYKKKKKNAVPAENNEMRFTCTMKYQQK